MMILMKAAIFDGQSHVIIKDEPMPELCSGEALIKVKYVGICGSDIAIYTGKNHRAKLPVIPGHEIVGEIVKLKVNQAKNQDSGFQIGERIAVLPTLACERCELCTGGKRHLCRSIHFIGIQTNGGYAEYAKIPINNLYHLPNGLSFEKAVLAEPLAVAIHAVRMAQVDIGDTALVMGAGPIGLLVAMIAKLSGCFKVIISEISPSRIELAQSLGFTTVDMSKDISGRQLSSLTDGKGFDLIFECVGHPSTVSQMIEQGKPEAQLIVVGAFKEPPAFDLFMMSRKEQRLVATWTYTRDDFAKAINYLDGSDTHFERVISHFIELEQTSQAIEMVRNAKDSMKVILKP
jgi:(R,R)-butanediol dehydrogenase/meso-butanediol dehydrogenase/diacetyl reductase